MLKTVGNPATRYGDQTIVDGNIVIGTAGKGIDFSASSHAPGMTSELLDDYEEGTFTPTVIGTGTAGTGTYSSQAGRYQKVGNTVHFELVVVWTAHTGTGNVRVTGLPFAPVNAAPEPPVSVLVGDVVFAGSPVGLVTIPSGDIALAGNQSGTGPSFTFLVTPTGVLVASGSYTTT
jgi:uncharacterized Zn-binding protein involved in type VI secretion